MPKIGLTGPNFANIESGISVTLIVRTCAGAAEGLTTGAWTLAAAADGVVKSPDKMSKASPVPKVGYRKRKQRAKELQFKKKKKKFTSSIRNYLPFVLEVMYISPCPTSGLGAGRFFNSSFLNL